MDGFKNSTRMKYMDEGISSRPTDSSGRRASNADLGIARVVDAPKKPMAKGTGAMAAAMAASKKATDTMKKGVPAKMMNSDREVGMVRRSKGGLMAMPKGKCK